MSTKAQLVAELDRSRRSIARDYAAVRHELDVKAKVENLVRRKPFAWLGGAAALGWILSGAKTKTRTVTKYAPIKDGSKPGPKIVKESARAGWVATMITLVKFALPLLKPVLTAYAGKRFTDMASRLAK